VKTASWCISGLAVAALLLGSVALAAPVPGDPSALKEVPATAPLVIHVRGVQGVAERFIDLLNQIAPKETAGIRTTLQMFLKDGVNGRKVQGLAKDGPIFVVFTDVPRAGEEPKIAVIAAVTNYRAAVDNLLQEDERKALKKSDAGYESTTMDNGKAIYLIDRKGYAVVTHAKDLAESLLRKPATGLDSRISPELGAKLLASDVGAYLSMDQFNKEYSEQIKAARNLGEQFIRMSKDAAGKYERSHLELVEKAIGPIFQAVEDSQGLLLALEQRPAGIALNFQSDVRRGTPTGKFLAQAQISAFQDFERLPAGQMFYTAIQPSLAMFQVMGGMMFGVMANLEGKEMKEAKEAVDQLIKARPLSQIGAATMPPAGLQVWTYADANQAMAAQMKLLESLTSGSGFLSGALKEKPVIKPRAQKYGSFEFTSVKVVWDLEKMLGESAANLGEDKKKAMLEMMKKMLGEEAHIWYGTDGKQVVQVAASNWESAEKLLEAYFNSKAPVGPLGNFRAVRKELPAETSIVVLFDLVRYIAAILEYTGPILQGAVPLPANYPPPLPPGKAPSFAGAAITMRPERGSMDLYFSTQAIKDAFETFVQPLLR
jgi:hypothetical protein